MKCHIVVGWLTEGIVTSRQIITYKELHFLLRVDDYAYRSQEFFSTEERCKVLVYVHSRWCSLHPHFSRQLTLASADVTLRNSTTLRLKLRLTLCISFRHVLNFLLCTNLSECSYKRLSLGFCHPRLTSAIGVTSLFAHSFEGITTTHVVSPLRSWYP
jgi:hypothetical protein